MTTLGRLTASDVQSVSVKNNQLIIKGSNLKNFTQVKLKNSNSVFDFKIESISATQIVANGLSNYNISAESLFDLILSNAQATATFPINFSIPANSITATMLTSLGAQAGQVMMFDGLKWVPTNFTSSQKYVGQWNASIDDPQLSTLNQSVGDYFIVSVDGIYNSVQYSAGDWIIFNGTTWEKISTGSDLKLPLVGGVLTGDLSLSTQVKFLNTANSNYVAIKSPSALASSYSITLPSVVGSNGQYLTTNGNGVLTWVSPVIQTYTTTDVSEGTNKYFTEARVLATKLINPNVNNAPIAANDSIQAAFEKLQGQINNKESLLANGGTISQYLRGDKSWQTLDTKAVAENSAYLYFTLDRVLGTKLTSLDLTVSSAVTASDSLLSAAGKLQAQVNSQKSTFIDWSTPGTQTIDPSRLNLGVGNTNLALVTNSNGFISTSTVTANELSYLSGTTGKIQDQLNLKQDKISKTSVQDFSKLRIYGTNVNNYVEVGVSGVLTSNTVFNFPTTLGGVGQFLQADGSGNTSWQTISSPVTKVNGATGAVTLNTDNILEGTSNFYFTNDRGIGATLTNFTTSTISNLTTKAVLAADSIITAIEKLQFQISNKADLTNTTQTITAASVTGLTAPFGANDAVNKAYVDSFGQWSKVSPTSTDINYTSGKVGVATTTPETALDVGGSVTMRGAYFESVGSLGTFSCTTASSTTSDITSFSTNLYYLTACSNGTTTLNIPTVTATNWPTGNMAWNVTFYVTGQTASTFNVSYGGSTSNVFWDKNSTGTGGGKNFPGFFVSSGSTDVVACTVVRTGANINVYCGVAAQY